MAVPIAELFVSVAADVNSAISGLNALDDKLKGTTSSFKQAAPAALALTVAAGAVGAGFLSAVKVAADFEHQMSGVKAVMSTEEIAQFGVALSDLALKLGRDTTFTSREAAAGIEELIKAGIPAASVLGGAAKAATDLAAATGIPVADAATIAAQAINTFGRDASNLTPVVDRLAAVANASASDVSFLRFGLAAAGGVAAGFGVSLDDTLVTLGLLSNRFATGADAGTSFKTFLNGLTPDTNKQAAAFKRLGLFTEDGKNKFFDAAGNVKTMAEVAGVLRTALGGLSAEQRQTSLQILFGTDAQRAANALYEMGGEKIQAFKDQTGASGVAAQSAATRLDNLQGALDQLRGSFESVLIVVGGFFTPSIRKLAEAIKGPVDAFSTLNPQVQGLVVSIVAVAGAVAGGLGGLVLLSATVAKLAPSFLALGKVLLAVSLPLGLLALAAGALFLAWQNNFGGIRNVVANAMGTIPGILARIGPILGNFGIVFEKLLAGNVGGALDTLRAIIGALSPDIGRFVDGTLELLKTGADSVATFWNENLSPALGRLGGFLETEVAPKIRQFVNGVLPTLQTGAETVRLFWDTQLVPAFGKLGAFLETEVGPKIQTFVDAVMPKLNEGAQAIITFWNEQLMPALRDPGPAMDALATSFESAVGRIGKAAETGKLGAGAEALAVFFANFDTIKGQVESLKPLFDSIGSFAGSILNLNVAIAALASRSAAPIFDAIGQSIKGFSEAVAPSVPAIAAIGEGLGTIGSALQFATDFFLHLADAINKFTEAVKLAPSLQAFLPSGTLGPGQAGPSVGGQTANVQGGINAGVFGAVAGGVGGPLVQIGQLVLGSEVDAQRFVADMAARLAAAAGRVNAPPDNSAWPALATP